MGWRGEALKLVLLCFGAVCFTGIAVSGLGVCVCARAA